MNMNAANADANPNPNPNATNVLTLLLSRPFSGTTELGHGGKPGRGWHRKRNSMKYSDAEAANRLKLCLNNFLFEAIGIQGIARVSQTCSILEEYSRRILRGKWYRYLGLARLHIPPLSLAQVRYPSGL